MKWKLVIIFCIFCLKLNAQQFLNGSFEYNHFNRCDSINISNSVFNSIVDNVYGIGILQSLDFFHDSCLVINAEDGDYFSSLETGSQDTNSTAISFLLSQPVLVLDTYIVSFYYKSTSNISQFQPIEIEIGYSENDSTVGTIVYTSHAPDTVWTKRFVSITPLVNAQYITAKGVTGTNDHFTIIDNFSFDTTGLYLAIEKNSQLVFLFTPTPAKKNCTYNGKGTWLKQEKF